MYPRRRIYHCRDYQLPHYHNHHSYHNPHHHHHHLRHQNYDNPTCYHWSYGHRHWQPVRR